MKVYNIGNSKVAAVEFGKIKEFLAAEKRDLNKCKWSKISKADVPKNIKRLSAPYSMSKLLELLEDDEYHFACVDAITKTVISKLECSDARVKDWFKNAQFPRRQNAIKLLRSMIKYNLACGNGLLIKSRNKKGEWVGLERFLPNQAEIVEQHNSETGYLEPDYIEVKNRLKNYIKNKDVIHFLEETYKSEVWGLASVQVAVNIEILKEIKRFDFNNFKNGLLIDYFIIVTGGSIRDNEVIDAEGNPVVVDGQSRTMYDVLEEQIRSASGNQNSHGSILLESEDQGVEIRLERMRPDLKDGGWLKLKKDLREGIFAYHRTPPRIVSQLVAGQLGGDNNSDLTLFYENKIKPIQADVALLLSEEFKFEFGWDIEVDSWDFGDITEAFATEDYKMWKKRDI